MVTGKCALGRGWSLPPRKVLVCLYPSTSIRKCLHAGKSFLNAIILNCNWENFWGGSLSVWGRSSPPPSRLNPGGSLGRGWPSMLCSSCRQYLTGCLSLCLTVLCAILCLQGNWLWKPGQGYRLPVDLQVWTIIILTFWLTVDHVIVLVYTQLPKSLLELQYAPGV